MLISFSRTSVIVLSFLFCFLVPAKCFPLYFTGQVPQSIVYKKFSKCNRKKSQIEHIFGSGFSTCGKQRFLPSSCLISLIASRIPPSPSIRPHSTASFPTSTVPRSFVSIFVLCMSFFQSFPVDPAVLRHKTYDPLLDHLKIFIRLCRSDHHPAHAHRMHQHRSGRHNKRIIRCHCKRNSDRMAVPDDKRDTVGLLKEAIISASASPQLTSPPIVLTRIRTPPIVSSLHLGELR